MMKPLMTKKISTPRWNGKVTRRSPASKHACCATIMAAATPRRAWTVASGRAGRGSAIGSMAARRRNWRTTGRPGTAVRLRSRHRPHDLLGQILLARVEDAHLAALELGVVLEV